MYVLINSFRTALYLNGSFGLENERLFLCDQLLNASYETLTSGRVTEPLGCHLHELQLWKLRYIWHRISLNYASDICRVSCMDYFFSNVREESSCCDVSISIQP